MLIFLDWHKIGNLLDEFASIGHEHDIEKCFSKLELSKNVYILIWFVSPIYGVITDSMPIVEKYEQLCFSIFLFFSSVPIAELRPARNITLQQRFTVVL